MTIVLPSRPAAAQACGPSAEGPPDPTLARAAARLGETVMPFTQGLKGHASDHEKATREEVVRRLARLKGCGSADELPQGDWRGPVYLVPSDTLVGTAHAQSLGVHGGDDLFGGVVPHAYVATKAITHPLVGPGATAPPHWSEAFPRQVAGAVLPGFTVFSREDARLAARALFGLGPIRVKQVCETGGRGQVVVQDADGLEECLAPLSDAALGEGGLVLEQNLREVETLSVGQVRVAGIVASYFGVQRLTPSNRGEMVYGGSDLTVIRGGFDVLRAVAPSAGVRKAVEQALVYDSAAKACFPGFFASRINYDVAQGVDAAGRWCSGVLEQSWRAGGATGAEIAALEAFAREQDKAPAEGRGGQHGQHRSPVAPGQQGPHSPRQHAAVQASCVEIFGPCEPPPEGAVLYFQGVDRHAGPLTKYTTVTEVTALMEVMEFSEMAEVPEMAEVAKMADRAEMAGPISAPADAALLPADQIPAVTRMSAMAASDAHAT